MIGGAIVASQIAVGWLLTNHVTAAIALAAILPGLALLVARPHWFWVLAFPANFLAVRVGPTGVDPSTADVVVLFAVLAALPSVPWHSKLLQRMQRLYAAYFALLMIVFVAFPNRETFVSLMQRSSMFLGAIFIGSAIGYQNRIRHALVALLATSCVVAIEAMRRSVISNFEAAYPFSLNKNATGAMLGMSIVLSFAAFSVFEKTMTTRVVVGISQIVLVGGLLATGARGAALALFGTLVVAVLRNEPGSRRPITVAALACVALVAYSTIKSVDNEKKNDQYSSANSRVVTYNAAIKLWERDPLIGVGIKYWRNPELASAVGFGEPHNVFVATLAETGLVGLGAFVLLMGGTFVTVFRRRSPLFRTTLLVMVFRFFDAQFGIFWVAVGGSLAWLMLGGAIGAELAAEEGDGDTGQRLPEVQQRHSMAYQSARLTTAVK